MLLLLIPVTLLALAGLLLLTDFLERRSSNALVQMAVRSPWSSPESVEKVVQVEASRRLTAAGLAERT